MGFSDVTNVNNLTKGYMSSNAIFLKKVVNKYVLLSLKFKKIIESKKADIIVVSSFYEKLAVNWPIRFSGSSVLKYFNKTTAKLSLIFYLRKNKSFIKGRYSKNRAYYRTGVYWCLYIHAIAILAFYYWFYRFTLNFGYLWWMFFIFAASFVFSGFLRIDGFNLNSFLITFFKNIEWFFFIIYSLFNNIVLFLAAVVLFFKKSKLFLYFFFLKKNIFFNYINFLLSALLKLVK